MNVRTETFKKFKYLHKQFYNLPHGDFPCIGASSAWKFLSSIVEIILQRFDDYSTRQIQFLNTALPLFETFCGYLDDSKLNKVPWSLIPSLEELFTKIKPGTEFVICPLWETNYKILNRNIIEYVDTIFLKIQGLVFDVGPDFDLKRLDFLSKYPNSIYFVFYPRTERLSVLHFPLLGHEIGHIFSTEWLDQYYEDTLNKHKIKSQIESYLNGMIPPDFIGPLFKPQFIDEQVEKIVGIYKMIMSEILADIIGAYIFGHAALLSNYVFSLKYKPDDFKGVPRGYLSWQFRLYFILKAFSSMMLEELPSEYSETNKLIDEIRSLCSSIDVYNYNYSSTNYKYIKFIIEIVEQEFDSICYEADRFLSGQQYFRTYSKDLQGKVIERLNNKIIPNCVSKSNLTEKPIDLRNIVGGTWLSLCELDYKDYETYFERSHTINLLSLKAIELSYHQKHFIS